MPGPLSPQGRQRALTILGAAVLLMGAGVLFRTVRVVHEVGRAGTYDRVKAVLVRRMGVSPARVAPDARLTAGLVAEGPDRLEFLLALEEEFQVEIPEAEAAAMVTVQDAVNAVERQLAAARR